MQLDSPSPKCGYIIQEVRGSDENANEVFHYWEAWQVLKGSDHAFETGASGDDAFSWVPTPGQPDRVIVDSSARYYDDIDNSDLYKMGFRQNAVPSAADMMFGTFTRPKLPTDNVSPLLVRPQWRSW